MQIGQVSTQEGIMRRLSIWIAIFAMVLSASGTFAQTTSGELVGTVKDATGAVVSNATVTVTNEATGVAVSVQATSGGEYRAGNLLPGSYQIVVNSPGFQPYTLHGVAVELNQTST